MIPAEYSVFVVWCWGLVGLVVGGIVGAALMVITRAFYLMYYVGGM